MINLLLGAALPIAMLGIVAFMLYAFVRQRRVFAVATGLAIAAFVCVTLVLGAKAVEHGSEMLGMDGARYLLFAWAIMVAYFISEWRFRVRLLGSILMPLAMFSMLVACFADRDAGNRLPLPAVDVAVHIALMFAFVVLVVVAFAGALIFLQKTRQLKDQVENPLDDELPAITTLRKLMVRPFTAGFPCITLGIILGIIWAGNQFESGWYWDAKILVTLLIWLVYALIFLLHHMGRLSNRALARGIIVIFIMTVGSFFFSSHSELLKTSLHTVDSSAAPTPAASAAPTAEPTATDDTHTP